MWFNSSAIKLAIIGHFIKRHLDGRLRMNTIETAWSDVDKAIFAMMEETSEIGATGIGATGIGATGIGEIPTRRKRSEPGQCVASKINCALRIEVKDNTVQNLEASHKTDSLDMIFHPEKAQKREQDLEAARQITRPEAHQTCIKQYFVQ